jgi:hypothetical protein
LECENGALALRVLDEEDDDDPYKWTFHKKEVRQILEAKFLVCLL